MSNHPSHRQPTAKRALPNREYFEPLPESLWVSVDLDANRNKYERAHQANDAHALRLQQKYNQWELS